MSILTLISVILLGIGDHFAAKAQKIEQELAERTPGAYLDSESSDSNSAKTDYETEVGKVALRGTGSVPSQVAVPSPSHWVEHRWVDDSPVRQVAPAEEDTYSPTAVHPTPATDVVSPSVAP